MRLEIDWTRCDGHGFCALLLPEQLRMEPDGFPAVLDPVVPDDDVRRARRAASVCPALALRLER